MPETGALGNVLRAGGMSGQEAWPCLSSFYKLLLLFEVALPSSRIFHVAVAKGLALAGMLLALACGGGGGGGKDSTPSPGDRPVIGSFQPASGPPGTAVTIRGARFTGATQVLFGTARARVLLVDSDSRITATAPQQPMAGPITVVTPSGRSVSAAAMTVLPLPPEPAPAQDPAPAPAPVPPPAVTGFDPPAALPGQQITLSGRHFSGATRVAFGGVQSPVVERVDDGRIIATLPAGAGSGLIEVDTASGTGFSAHPLTVQRPAAAAAGAPPPVITGVAPTEAGPGDEVVIEGRHFTGVRTVAFGGLPAASFRVHGDGRITATVSALGATGQVAVATGAGRGVSRQPFTARPPEPPVIDGFSPALGQPGTRILVTGQRFRGATRVDFRGAAGAPFTLESDTRLWVTVPAGAASGVITVHRPRTLATSATAFGVVPPAPVIRALRPAGGPAGTPVLIQGSGFRTESQVLFNGLAASWVEYAGPEELRAAVPPGAVTGPLRVLTLGAETQAPFQVDPGAPAPSVHLEGWYITQATQALGPVTGQPRTGTVPLVAGRDGWLRVFLRANRPGLPVPAVRATFTGGAPSPWQQTLTAASAVPLALEEGRLASSWNLRVPGALLRPGARLRLELDPGGAVPGVDRSGNAVQHDLDIRQARPMRITLVPIRQPGGLAGDVYRDGRTPADWVDLLRRIYPFASGPAGLDLQVGAPMDSSVVLRPDDDDTWFRMIGELCDRQLSDGALDRFYYGVVRLPYRNGTFGLSAHSDDLGFPAAVGTDAPRDYQVTLAHELGHLMGRDHARCPPDLRGLNASWPEDDQFGGIYRDGRIGVHGFDVAAGQAKDPLTCSDIMGYCPNPWISDWTYRAVLAWRDERAGGPYAAFRGPAARRQRCLRLAGQWRDGRVDLEPGFILPAYPALPKAGDLVLELCGEGGRVLASFPFSRSEPDPETGGPAGAFAFTLPLDPQLERELRSVRIMGGGHVLAERGPGPQGPMRLPWCTTWGPGTVHLSWDAQAHPRVMVLDPRNGCLIGFGVGGSAEFRTGARRLDVLFSDGVRSSRRRLKVR